MRSHEDSLWRSSQDLILRKIFAEFLRKTFWRFSNIQKFYINFLRQAFTYLQAIKSFWDLCKIFISYLFEIFARSSFHIFLRSTENILVIFLIFGLKKIKKFCLIVKNSQKIVWRSSYKSSKNLFEISWRSQ